jgi:hypothetical protein
MQVDVGFLYIVKCNLLCFRFMVRSRKFSFLSDSCSTVNFIAGCIILKPSIAVFTCVLM